VIVEIAGLVKEFSGRRAVDGLDLTVEKGEMFCLLGPNGAGKTTLIHMLLGLVAPTRGEIRLFGKSLAADRQEILSRCNFSSAYVQMPQSLTPRQNLRVFAALYGVGEEKVEENLRRMELLGMADRPTRGLSSGQHSRLSLAKALLNDPELLLLDEPTASMDPDIADKTRAILREVQKDRGLTVFYTSHNMREVEELATRVVFLRAGKIVAQGSPKELLADFAEDDLEKLFLRIARQ
jgi:ABC-2 type transport system ATP-binding protein